jgi:hypothetical protein
MESVLPSECGYLVLRSVEWQGVGLLCGVMECGVTGSE